MNKPDIRNIHIPNIVFDIVVFVALAAMTVLLFPRYNSAFHYDFTLGKPWGYELKTAEFDFPIYKTDEQIAAEQQKLLRDFAPCYSYLPGQPETPMILSMCDMDQLKREGCTRIRIVRNKVTETHALSEIYTPKTAYQKWQRTVSPNLQADTATTQRLRTQLLATISPTQGIVQAGEKIIDRGEIVSEKDFQILESLRRAYDERSIISRSQRIQSTLGETLMVCLFLGMFCLYLFVFRSSYLYQRTTILFFCMVSALVIALSCLTLRYTTLSIYLIPFAWVPILTRVFKDARTALYLHFTTVLIVSLIVPKPVEFFFIQISVGMVAVSSLSDMTRRAQLATTAGWIFLTQVIAYTAFTLASAATYHALVPKMYLFFALNALLIIASYGLIFLFEKLFRFVSSITLVELTDINSDLLHSLAEKAPGTFQHAMQVSNLATEAAKRIGANALLVRTGALYHDIGKMSAPHYYTENQQGGANPLAVLPPEEAARIIIDHVAEGERIARHHHLPEAVVRFITSHHGTSVTRYFYNTYANAHPGEPIDKRLFSYPGPKPNTKEGAILMMADAIEARSHSLPEITEQSLSEMVDQMINQQIADGQFADTPLSFKDVEDIRCVFKQRLTAIHHHRIAYPTLNK